MCTYSQNKIISATLFCLISVQSFASFIYVPEQSVSAMGNSFAGVGAAGEDVSIGFYNPAGLTLIKEGEVVGALTYAATNIDLQVDSVTNLVSKEIPGAAGANYFAVPQTPIPALHAAAPISEDLVVGMSLTAPFWGVVDFSDTLVRGVTNEINMTGYNANLSLAYKLTRQLSLGLGLNAQYFNAKYDSYLNAPTQGNENATIAYAKYRGDDFVVYPNVGLLFEFTEQTRMGLAYRFPVTHDTNGPFEIQVFNTEGTNTAVYDGTLEVPLPGITTLSFFHALTPKIELLADISYTEWSRWQDFVIFFEIKDTSGLNQTIDNSVPLNLVDTWRFGVGANYILNNTIKFRVGGAYDQSPVQDEYRLIATPDSNQIDVSVGMGITPRSWKKTAIDIAYMHTFFASAPVMQPNTLNLLDEVIPIPPSANSVEGNFDSQADFFGIQIVRKM